MTIAALRNTEGQFSGKGDQKDHQEHCKRRDGSDGSVVANHCDGSESLVVVTTLICLSVDHDTKLHVLEC